MISHFCHRVGPCCRMFAALCAAALAVSCAARTGPSGDSEFLPLQEGVRRLTGSLLATIPSEDGQPRAVAVDRFVDAASGEVPRAAARIEALMLEAAAGQEERFQAVRLTSERGPGARYLIAGTISPEEGPGFRYRLRGLVKDVQGNRVIGEAVVRIAEPGFDYTPMAIFQDNPFFDPAYRKTKIPDEPTRAAGPPGFEDYSVQTLALLRAGAAAYERSEYATALSLFEEAAGRPDGRTLWTHAGLYLAYEKLGRTEEAETAFGNVVSLSVEKHRMLTVRFLFKVDSVVFWGGEPARRRYEAWLRHIGSYFSRTGNCLKIVGHCSSTGPESWNRSLSLMRALKIQEMLGKTLPEAAKRTRAEGRGSEENVVGTGTDDERDVLDRRVELMIVDCPPM